jgi:glucose/arabinose dehydrogenase
MRRWLFGIFGIIALAMLGAWGGASIYSRGPNTLLGSDTIGANPKLPSPRAQIIPTINVAPALGWAPGRMPTAPVGFTVTRFAEGLKHPRWLYPLPNGDILVAEASTRAFQSVGNCRLCPEPNAEGRRCERSQCGPDYAIARR